jgi:hypothetical protein
VGFTSEKLNVCKPALKGSVIPRRAKIAVISVQLLFVYWLT